MGVMRCLWGNLCLLCAWGEKVRMEWDRQVEVPRMRDANPTCGVMDQPSPGNSADSICFVQLNGAS